MKTVLELASEIEKNQEGYKALLDLFKTNDDGLRLTLLAYKDLPAQIVPGLLRSYSRLQFELELATKKITVNDILNSTTYFMFELEEDQKTYVFRGYYENQAMFVELGKNELKYINPSLPIRRLF
jgi:hypothetical protein